MSSLDQAFIKAFAKDRKTCVDQRSDAKLHVQEQPPADGVESVSLVLEDQYGQGKRLRIDRPRSDQADLEAHIVLPLVEHVESYDPAELSPASESLVVYDDRLVEVETLRDAMPTDDPGGDRRTSSSARENVQATSGQCSNDHVERPVADDEPVAGENAVLGDMPTEETAESNVVSRTEADLDKEVPTLDLSPDDGQVELPRTAFVDEDAGVAATARVDELSSPQVPAESQSEAAELVIPVPQSFDVGRSDVANLAATRIDVSAVDLALDTQELAIAAMSERNTTVTEELASTETFPVEVESGEQVEVAKQRNVAADDAAQRPFGVGALPHVEQADVAKEDDPRCDIASDQWSVVSFPISPDVDEENSDASEQESASEANNSGTETEIGGRPEKSQLVPAWEVDAFRWPDLCRKLDEQTDGRLAQSGEELFVATQDGLKVLAVTSSQSQEGRTTLALSLAHAAARAGSRVALVDADAGNPELARQLGMEAPCDWREVLRRDEPLSEAAVTSLEDHVTLFPRTVPSELEDGRFDEPLAGMLRDLSRHFDLVIVDLPPVRESGHRREHGEDCPIDMAVVVRNVRATSESQCLKTVRSMRQLGVRAIGVVENFVHANAGQASSN